MIYLSYLRKVFFIVLVLMNCSLSYAGRGNRNISQDWQFLSEQRKQQGRFSEKHDRELFRELDAHKSKNSLKTPFIEPIVEYDIPVYLPESKPYARSSSPIFDLRSSKGKFLATLLLTSSFIYAVQASDLKEGEVRVRVWNSALREGEHYGHVSVETHNSYISLWPTGIERIDIPQVGALQSKAIGHKSYVKDKEIEGRDPEKTYDISLDVKKIDDEWNKLKSNADEIERGYLFRDIVWYAAGDRTALDNIIGARTERKSLFSCATMAMTMLKHGGIDRWVDEIMALDGRGGTRLEGLLKNGLLTPDEVGDVVEEVRIKQIHDIPSKPSVPERPPSTSFHDKRLEKMAAQTSRSCVIYLENNSPTYLELIESELSIGEWIDWKTPPKRIDPGQSVVWASSNSWKYWSGTKGFAIYRSGIRGKVSIFWNNPYVGFNRIYGSPEIEQSGLQGNNAVVRFYFN